MRKVLNDIKCYLEKFREIYGVETAILSQRDGFPISIVGVWLSEDEIFGVCSSSSAIYAAAQQLSKGLLNYLFIEGNRVNMVISPLQDLREFCFTIVTRPRVNLGAIFLKMHETFFLLRNAVLNLSDIKPPLRKFTEDEIKNILKSFLVKPGEEAVNEIKHEMLELDGASLGSIRRSLEELLTLIKEIELVSLIYEGGYLVLSLSRSGECNVTGSEDVLAYSLMDTATRLMWITKKTVVERVMCDCKNYMFFIYDLGGCILVIKTVKGQIKLGFLRLIINSCINKIQNILRERKMKKPVIPKIGKLEELQLSF